MSGELHRHGHWCDFCQMFHSSASCYHPSNKGERTTHPSVAALEQTVESLRVCGNCRNYAGGHWHPCHLINRSVSAHEHCPLTPSRWAERC